MISIFMVLGMLFGGSLYGITPENANALGHLQYALIKKEPLEKILEIINKDIADTNVGDFHGMTSFLIASLSGDPELIKYMLTKRPQVYTVDFEGKNALMYVAGSKRVPDTVHAAESLQLLAKDNAYDNTAQALTLAARAGHVGKVATLLKVIPVYSHHELADIITRLTQIENTYKKIVLKIQSAKKSLRFSSTREVKQVPNYSLKTDFVIENLGEVYRDIFSSKIFTASTQAKLDSLQSMNTQDTWNMTPLMIAAKGKNLAMFSYVLAKKPEWRLYDMAGDTALVFAAGNEMYQGLLLSDMIVSKNNSGLTHAEELREKISFEMVEKLFAQIIPPTENADYFAYALQAAIKAGFSSVVELLLKHGFYTLDQLTYAEQQIDQLLKNFRQITGLLQKKISNSKS
jgi:ankyrin repeat protein